MQGDIVGHESFWEYILKLILGHINSLKIFPVILKIVSSVISFMLMKLHSLIQSHLCNFGLPAMPLRYHPKQSAYIHVLRLVPCLAKQISYIRVLKCLPCVFQQFRSASMYVKDFDPYGDFVQCQRCSMWLRYNCSVPQMDTQHSQHQLVKVDHFLCVCSVNPCWE